MQRRYLLTYLPTYITNMKHYVGGSSRYGLNNIHNTYFYYIYLLEIIINYTKHYTYWLAFIYYKQFIQSRYNNNNNNNNIK